MTESATFPFPLDSGQYGTSARAAVPMAAAEVQVGDIVLLADCATRVTRVSRGPTRLGDAVYIQGDYNITRFTREMLMVIPADRRAESYAAEEMAARAVRPEGTACERCGAVVSGSHYHCGECDSPDLTGMWGHRVGHHYINGKWRTDPRGLHHCTPADCELHP